MGWLTATFAALPALIDGLAAYQTRRAELMAPVEPTHAATEADDDAELAKREASAAKGGAK